ncbi:MAG TPA: 5'-nucleotidase C-terminal domain-containing protein [Marmoricola sp.]|nr:5'-nucleotidase C-terminal domain-containing protein [Marmoricola sp.]
MPLHLTRRAAAAATAALAATATAAALAVPAAASGGTNGKIVDVTVLGTSDLHGNVFNWDYFKDAPFSDGAHDSVGLAQVSTVVNDVRAQVGRDHTLLLDSGDTIQGTPLAYYYAKVEPFDTTGQVHPMAAAMNAIGYDAQTLGNHEYNYGIPLLDDWVKQVKAPVLAANAIDDATGQPAYTPYVIKTMKVPGEKPIRVGVLGLTNPGIALWDKANVEGKQHFEDLVKTAQLWVPRMRAAGADVVVVTAHAGDSGVSSYGTDLPVENAAALVASKVPGIDAVLFGHAHKDVPEEFVDGPDGKVLLAEPSKWGQRVTRMDFDLQKVRGRWQVVHKESTNINTNTVQPDQRILHLIQPQHDKTVAYVNQVIATSTEEMPAARSAVEDTPILDFIQQAQTDTVKSALAGTQYADLPVLSIAAPFSRDAVFHAGNVRIKDVAGLYIYDNTLEAVVMNGQEVREYLECSAKYFKPFTKGASALSLTNAPYSGGIHNCSGSSDSQPDYNYDVLSGLKYTIDVARPLGSRITSLTHLDGTPVGDGEQFVVAVNNYRRSGGGGFGDIVKPQVYNQQKEIRQLLIDWAQAKGVIDPKDFFDRNWTLEANGEPLS